uniref:Ig-like domain-containing protein n=2 Tax=Anabas testudineus TaxID=64144 RepID=A0A3Q1IMY0_ANATE
MNDNKTFKCHVQAKTDTTKSYATTRVLVLVPPSQPVVGIQGKAEYGQNINLTCLSKDGSPPPTYKWQSYDVQNNPRPFDPKTTDQGGILSLYNISKDTSGYFICTSTNKMGSATSNLTLAVLPPSMNVGSTAGIVAGVAIALLILAILIYCCCCRKKKDKGEEYAMGVHEDEYHDKEDAKKAERHPDGQEEVRTSENTYVNSAPDRRDEYEERSERGNDRRRDYDDRRSDYDDRRSDYDDRRSDYDDRRSDYDDRRSDYNDRRSDYDDRRSDYSDRRDRYNDRNERYNDNRRYDDDRRNDRRDRRNDDDRYDETRDDRSRDKPAVPSNKPPRRN